MTEIGDLASTQRVLAARAALGPIGVHLPTIGALEPFPMPQQLDAVRRLEDAGYRAAWVPEGVGGHDGMVEIAAMLGVTRDLVFGSSVANMWARPAATLHAASAVLAEAFPGRFVLGIGPGYPYQAEALGLRYERPLTLMREYVEAMTRPAPMITVAEQTFARILAANRPKMVELAGTITDGVHPGLIPVEETADIRARIGPDKLLVVALLIIPVADRPAALDAAKSFVAGALGFPGSPYAANLVRLGYRMEELTSGGDRVVNAVIAYGGPDEIAAKAQEYLDAGADHVLINPALPGYDLGVEHLEWLAPALNSITA
jgi:probable F420-dependent oxidoreductase